MSLPPASPTPAGLHPSSTPPATRQEGRAGVPQDDDITLNPKPLPGWEDDAVGLVPRPAGMETPGGEAGAAAGGKEYDLAIESTAGTAGQASALLPAGVDNSEATAGAGDDADAGIQSPEGKLEVDMATPDAFADAKSMVSAFSLNLSAYGEVAPSPAGAAAAAGGEGGGVGGGEGGGEGGRGTRALDVATAAAAATASVSPLQRGGTEYASEHGVSPERNGVAGGEGPQGGEEEGTLPSSAAQAGVGGTHSNSSGEERQEGGEDGVGEGDTEEAEGAVSAGQRSSAGEGYSGEGLQGGGGQQEGGAGGVSVGQLAASGKMVEEEEVFAEDEAFDDFASAKAGVYKV